MIQRSVSECHLSLPQGDGHTPVILGEPGDAPLLGAVTLEILGFVLHPLYTDTPPGAFAPRIADGRARMHDVLPDDIEEKRSC